MRRKWIRCSKRREITWSTRKDRACAIGSRGKWDISEHPVSGQLPVGPWDRQQLIFPDQQLAMQLHQQRDRLFLPQLHSPGHGNVFGLSLHREECVDPSDRLARHLRRRFLRLHKLPAGLRTTTWAGDGVTGHQPVVTPVSVDVRRREEPMTTAFRNIERARGELTQLQGELLELEKHMNSMRESLGNPITELFGTGLDASQETLLAARIAEVVVSRLPLQVSTVRQYVREREAAEYMGVKVATLRAWRLLRSKNGPPFTRVGRMVMYPMAALEEHMRAGLVPYRD
jgi:hypothetical protein